MSTLRTRPRHRRETRVRALVRGFGTASLVVGGLTAAAVVGSSGSLASWVDAAPVSSGTVTSGTATLELAASFDAGAWSNLLPGESVRQPISLTNTGDVPLALTAGGSAPAALELRVSPGACAGALTGDPVTATPAALGTLAPGASQTACVEVRIAAGATPATTADFTVTVTGVQA